MGKLKGPSPKGIALVMEPVVNIEGRKAENPKPPKAKKNKKDKKSKKNKNKD
jgi:hypothetical protein